MGTVLDFGDPARSGKGRPAASFGLVTRRVDSKSEISSQSRGRKGVIHMGGLATVCLVEDVPAGGDVIQGATQGVVARVKITRRGRVLIYAWPVRGLSPTER